jgi:hypothetical protein
MQDQESQKTGIARASTRQPDGSGQKIWKELKLFFHKGEAYTFPFARQSDRLAK